MQKTLIIYSTTDGQTQRICERLTQAIGTSKLVSMTEVADETLADYDQIVVGASIRYGKHKPAVYHFIEKNRALLTKTKTAFFSVNVVARKPEKNTPETNPYMQKFLELSAWKPDVLTVFAGRLNYPQYRFIDKIMIRMIMYMTKGPTDTSQTYEFTDWVKVDEFADTLAKQKLTMPRD
jgi:menaquinone-dependent protoporphyrinogen oxidase